mgnify:FL=1
MRSYSLLLALILLDSLAAQENPAPIEDLITEGFVDNDGVQLHYASLGGKGPLVVMLHGFPDFWYTWREQMRELAKDHHVVAFDSRGYNKSSKPEGVAQYAMPVLVGDVAAVIQHFGHQRAVVVGHDWGGMIAWSLAMSRPELVDRLIICNLPHPRGLQRELARNENQQKNSQYARDFQAADAHTKLTASGLARWVKDDAVRTKYVAAFERSDFAAMLNYYKANFPKSASTPAKAVNYAKVKAPVLMMHGLDDQALLPAALNDTWKWLEKDLTLVTVPGAGHFVQQDASAMVTRSMRMWLHRDGAPIEKSPAFAAVINQSCPFSGDPVKADSITLYKGKVIGFCNPGCRDKFATDPAAYLAQIPELAAKEAAGTGK